MKRASLEHRDSVTSLPSAAAVVRSLRAWFRRHRRDLPWRENRDPYRVWVSEIMLQQTQVERVKEFFTRFMARFPTVAALAAAREPEVLRLWEGLGYYRRARQLHEAARRIAGEHAGRLPESAAALQGLPGIGRYTAGAIASIAFGAREPIIEANSRRVIARLVGHTAAVGGAGDEPLWRIAAKLVPAREPGIFNQAVMELGALVCTPERPGCSRCPLASLCVAHRTGRVDEIPAMPPRREVKQLRETALVIRHGGRVLVERRRPGEWWEGLWDFPRASRAAGDRKLGEVVYTVTHHRVTCRVVERREPQAPQAGPGRRLVSLTTLAGLAMTAPGRRIAALLTDE